MEFNLKNGRKTFSFKELVNIKGKNKNTAKQYIKYSISRKFIKNLSKSYLEINSK